MSPRPSDDLTAAATAAIAYTALAVSAQQGRLDDVNWRVRRRVLARRPRTVRLARMITLLSESGVHPLLGYLLSRAVSRVTGRQTRAPLIASLAVFALNKGTRLVVHQPRPPGAKPRRGIDRLGYPSGHTLAATAIALTTALQLGDDERTPALRTAAAYAALIGWTRLVLDEHWIDDVLGAWAGGVVLAVAVDRAERATRPRIRRRALPSRAADRHG